MRLTALAGLFACAMIFAVNSPSVSAQSTDVLNTNNLKQESFNIGIMADIRDTLPVNEPMAPPAAPPAPEPKVHEIKEGETLSDIAQQYDIAWQRIFNKNEQVAHPDVIRVGDKVTIPLADEQLAERPLPQPPVPAPAPATQAYEAPVNRASGAAPVVSRGAVAGNTYAPGWCTWYAKNMRPDLPNNLGNADTWVSRAAAQGIPTGSAPRVGAIGQRAMHVVYVQSVNGDGTVTISEMNYVGLYIVSSRTVPASTFHYIY